MDRPGAGPMGRSCVWWRIPVLQGDARLSAKYWTYIVSLMQSPWEIRSSSLCLKPRLDLNNPKHSLVPFRNRIPRSSILYIWPVLAVCRVCLVDRIHLSPRGLGDRKVKGECLGTMESRPWVWESGSFFEMPATLLGQLFSPRIVRSLALLSCPPVKDFSQFRNTGRQNSNLWTELPYKRFVEEIPNHLINKLF